MEFQWSFSFQRKMIRGSCWLSFAAHQFGNILGCVIGCSSRYMLPPPELKSKEASYCYRLDYFSRRFPETHANKFDPYSFAEQCSTLCPRLCLRSHFYDQGSRLNSLWNHYCPVPMVFTFLRPTSRKTRSMRVPCPTPVTKR